MARKMMVRYKVKADRAEENAAYIQRVFEELAQTQPEGLRYASFRQNDGVSFVHIAFIFSVQKPSASGQKRWIFGGRSMGIREAAPRQRPW